MSGVTAGLRPVWAEVDLAAVAHNAGVLARASAPALLCAVVKAGGYGHGAVPVARAALAGGARWLAVAMVSEGLELRAAGIDAPVLVLSEPEPAAMAGAVGAGLTPTLYTGPGVVAAAAAAAGGGAPLAVHVKVDTGMYRVGAAPDDAVRLALEVEEHRGLRLEGLFTHLAVADEVDDPYTAGQLARFAGAVDRLAGVGVRPPLLHAANSAGALWHPEARLDMVRCGISLYGLAPCAGRPAGGDGGRWLDLLRPALALRARVSFVKEVAAGERISYGLRYRLEQPSVIATVPIGYADGLPRRLGAVGGEVLIGGRRLPIAGTVTMDQVMVDCGAGAAVAAGDEVTLIGAQGDHEVGAWEWAERVGTIAYEVVCGLGERVPRTYLQV
ncbi:MAG: alanine racemase [Acidimicrobiales bacterium]